MSESKPTLWHITISHYSEKVRWALDHKSVEHDRRAPPPSSHIPIALWFTRGRHFTFPVLELDGRRIGDSTEIIAALEERFPDPPLYPADPAERRRALELEDWFDEELGPHIRRHAFHELARDPELFSDLAAQAMPPALRRMRRLTGAYGRVFTAVRFGAGSAKAAEQSRAKVLAALDRLEAELGDNEYLVGERFTIADLTAAALMFPIVMPPEGPVTISSFPAGFAQFRAPLENRRGFQWTEEMFRRHRRAQPAPSAEARAASAVGP